MYTEKKAVKKDLNIDWLRGLKLALIAGQEKGLLKSRESAFDFAHWYLKNTSFSFIDVYQIIDEVFNQ